MWLPRPVYEAKPYVGIGLGLACLAAAWGFKRAPHSVLLVLGALLVTLGMLLWMKRRDYRSTQSDYDPRAIDETESSLPSASPSGPAAPVSASGATCSPGKGSSPPA